MPTGKQKEVGQADRRRNRGLVLPTGGVKGATGRWEPEIITRAIAFGSKGPQKGVSTGLKGGQDGGRVRGRSKGSYLHKGEARNKGPAFGNPTTVG